MKPFPSVAKIYRQILRLARYLTLLPLDVFEIDLFKKYIQFWTVFFFNSNSRVRSTGNFTNKKILKILRSLKH